MVTTPEEREGRARGSLLGLAVGDALGGPAEFLGPDQITSRHGGPIQDMIGRGWLGLRPGQVTDDTDMALCLARSLIDAYDQQEALRRYLEWFASNPPDVGTTVGAVLGAVENGEDATAAAERFHESSGGKSAGNGSIMRCAPLALRYADNHPSLIDAATADSRLTHYDPLAAEACSVFCALVATRITGQQLLEMPARNEAVPAALNASREEATQRATQAAGFVLTALAIAVCAYRTAESFEDGVVWAINLGGDADTNGAVAGALLGARFGATAIPSRWLETLEPAGEVREIADQLMNGRE